MKINKPLYNLEIKNMYINEKVGKWDNLQTEQKERMSEFEDSTNESIQSWHGD